MNRKQFIVSCGLCVVGLPTLLSRCAGTKYINAPIDGDSLVVPLQSFITEDQKPLKYVVVHNDRLEYPVCIYRFSESDFKALLMKCTHQGTELQVFGDRLQCPAHGSEFTNSGAVQNGPADTPLRTFNVSVNAENIRIKLS
jgi:nitrite reductase/ring-hydroxylating ferredoxin subunit